MSLWNGLHRGLREKAVKSIRHTLKAEVLSKMTADEPRPAIEPLPTLELDPELLAAFLAEPEPEEIDLGPLVTLQRGSRIAIENDSDYYERATDRTEIFGLGGSNTDDDYSAAEDELDTTAGNRDDGIAEEEDENAVDDSDMEHLELSEVDDDI